MTQLKSAYYFIQTILIQSDIMYMLLINTNMKRGRPAIKKPQIIKLWSEGMSYDYICDYVGSRYNFVVQTISDHKKDLQIKELTK